MRDVWDRLGEDYVTVLILIHLDHHEPPTGTIALPRDSSQVSDQGRLIEFAGWLGMLHALQEVVDTNRQMG